MGHSSSKHHKLGRTVRLSTAVGKELRLHLATVRRTGPPFQSRQALRDLYDWACQQKLKAADTIIERSGQSADGQDAPDGLLVESIIFLAFLKKATEEGARVQEMELWVGVFERLVHCDVLLRPPLPKMQSQPMLRCASGFHSFRSRCALALDQLLVLSLDPADWDWAKVCEQGALINADLDSLIVEHLAVLHNLPEIDRLRSGLLDALDNLNSLVKKYEVQLAAAKVEVDSLPDWRDPDEGEDRRYARARADEISTKLLHTQIECDALMQLHRFASLQ